MDTLKTVPVFFATLAEYEERLAHIIAPARVQQAVFHSPTSVVQNVACGIYHGLTPNTNYSTGVVPTVPEGDPEASRQDEAELVEEPNNGVPVRSKCTESGAQSPQHAAP